MGDYLIFTFIASFLFNLLIIKYSNKYNLALDPISNKIQSFHNELIPRAGSISIYLFSLLFLYPISEKLFLITLSFLPVFIYGLYEDLKGDTPHKNRLIFMSISALLAVIFADVKIHSIGFINIPVYLQIPFTVFSIVGLSSAINFIDGLNGLASGVSIVSFILISLSSLIIGDSTFSMAMCVIASLIFGFFILNFPFGKIFLGDAGAYFIGYLLATSSIYLVFDTSFTSNISPWFPASLMCYPIVETFVTMARRYKRKKRKGIPFFNAERTHLHSLLYRRITRNNPLATLVILLPYLMFSIISYNNRYSDISCFLIFLTQSILYIVVYLNIVNFRIGKYISLINKKLRGNNKYLELNDIRTNSFKEPIELKH